MHSCSSTPVCPPAESNASQDASPDASWDACQGALHELIEIGMDLARLVREEAQSAVLPVAEASVAFERVARAVRRTVRLVQWLEQPSTMRAGDGGQRRVTARTKVIRAVEDGIDREAAEGEADCLHAELLERLDSVEFEEDVAGRPVAEVIREILDDLGLAAAHGSLPARRRRLEDVAVLHARAAAAVGEARGVAGAAFELGRAELGGVVVGDLSKLSDEELERLYQRECAGSG